VKGPQTSGHPDQRLHGTSAPPLSYAYRVRRPKRPHYFTRSFESEDDCTAILSQLRYLYGTFVSNTMSLIASPAKRSSAGAGTSLGARRIR